MMEGKYENKKIKKPSVKKSNGSEGKQNVKDKDLVAKKELPPPSLDEFPSLQSVVRAPVKEILPRPINPPPQTNQSNPNQPTNTTPRDKPITPNQSTVQNKPLSKSKKAKQPLALADFLARPAPPKPAPIPEKSKLDVNPNPIASDRFIQRRGKERLNPKPKKFTKLKKIILDEREKRYNEFIGEKSEEVNVEESDIPKMENASKEESVPSEEKEDIEESDSDSEQSVPSSSSDSENEEEAEKTEVDSKAALEQKLSIPKVPNKETPHRNYCKQVITPEFNEKVVSLLSDLRRFYTKQKTINPLKAKKRLVNGLREVLRAADRNKLKMAILAPNIDEVAAPGGLDDYVGQIITLCKKKSIPIVFALKKRTLGHAMGKNQKVSAVGVVNPEGAYETFQQIIKMAENGKRLFREQELNPVVPPPVEKTKKRRKRSHKKKKAAVVEEEEKVEKVDEEKEKLGKWAVPLQKVLQSSNVDNKT